MSQQECIQIFEKVAEALKQRSWFKSGKWRVSTHAFPPNKPEFQTFHLFKAGWFNEEKQGIHIESFLAFDPKKRKKSFITLHVLQYKVIPDTKIKREAVARPLVDLIFDEVAAWDGYKFRAGKYGLQPFTRYLDGTSPAFEKELIKEATQMCRYLGPKIDKVLKEVL